MSGSPFQIAGSENARCLLAVKKPGKEIDHRGKNHTSSKAHHQAQAEPVVEVAADGAEAAEGGNKDAQNAARQNARSAVAFAVVAIHVVADIAVFENVAENRARDDEHKSENRDGQKRPKS